MTHRTNRRCFLQATALSGFGIWLPRGTALGAGRWANERLAFACIGVGGKGSSDTDHVGELGDVVALCDIDSKRLKAKREKFPEAKPYHDFRELLSALGSKVDAVVVSTPDHTHAPAALMAMKLGKPVYCQKPLTHAPHEARLLRETAAKKKVATQMGNQGTAHPGFRSGIERIRSGAIGAVREVHVWTNRPFKYWKQAPDITARPAETPPVPEHVAWDLWLGPAPERPYNPVYHPHDWRGWWDFGTGALGDMACHTTNLPYMALKLGLPTRVSAQSGPVNPETYPAWATITYEFPARGELPPVKLTWYEGARDGKRHLPPAELFRGKVPSDSGSLLVGETGSLFSPSDYGAEQIILASDRAEEKSSDSGSESTQRKEKGPDHDLMHKAEWVRAIKENDPSIAWSNFDYSGRLTETMLLGNVAVRVGQPIEYDPATGRVTNCPEAQQYLQPKWRSGWEV